MRKLFERGVPIRPFSDVTVRSAHLISAVSNRGDTIQLPTHTFLECFPDGAALLGPDLTILYLNSYLRQRLGSVEGRLCYEGLAGLSEPCAFCPLEELKSAAREAPVKGVQVRDGFSCLIGVRAIQDASAEKFILETVRELIPEPLMANPPSNGEDELSARLNRCTALFRIAQDLAGTAPFEEKIVTLLNHMRNALHNPPLALVWCELGGTAYGDKPTVLPEAVALTQVDTEEQLQGSVFLAYADGREVPREEVDMLAEVAALLGQQAVAWRREEELKESEARYRQMAEKVAREMWFRTEALAQERSYLEGILRSSDDIIITTDLDSRIAEFNHGAEKLLGYAAEDMQGTKVEEIWEEASERIRIMEQIRRGDGIRNYETRLRTKSGEFREVSLTLSPLIDEEGNTVGTVGISKDISKEKTIVRELEILNQNYRETMGFINHETKNSLIVMGGFVRRLLKKETDPQKREQLGIVYHHCKFLEAMSKDFLVMAALEHGELQVRKTLIEDFHERVIYPAVVGLKERYPDSISSYDTSMGGVRAYRSHGRPGTP